MGEPASGVVRTAAILAIGSEMLGPLRQDTNSLWLTARLEEIGISVVRKAIVGDDPAVIRQELDNAARAAEFLFTTGGLGPTADDVTVEAVARWLGASLARNQEFLEKMRQRFARRGFTMPACNEKQADFIVGAEVLENPRGTAPGFWGNRDGTEIVLLPGVPSEMKEIMENRVLPRLRQRGGGIVGRRRVLRIAGMGESAVEEMVAPLYAKWKDDPVTILASPGEVQLHLAVRGTPEEAQRRLDAMEADYRDVLGSRIFGEDADELSIVVGRLLREGHRTIALAESCTGGLISAMLTDVPGSSEYFLGSVVSYANTAKEGLLGVGAATLQAHGAVSGEAAEEMARGARERFDADLALSVTGIAGPDGGSAEKPVGTVYFALAERQGDGRARKQPFHRRPIRRAPRRSDSRSRDGPPAPGRGARVRAFLAVPADPGWVQSARELVGRLESSLPRAAWTRPQAWHLTLKFLGEIDEASASRFADAIGGAVGGAEIELDTRGAIGLPSGSRPRVLGVGFAPGPGIEALGALAAKAEAAAVRIGVVPDARPFRPHVTFARVRNPWPAAATASFRSEVDRWSFPVWHVRSCVLYRSRLDPSGAVHTPVREWPLAIGAGAQA